MSISRANPKLDDMTVSSDLKHLQIGALIFPRLDQCDFTGPFEVLSRIPDSTFHVIGKDLNPVRDMHGLQLVPEMTIAEVPRLDLLVVPGGPGQEDLMEDETTLSFLRNQAKTGCYILSVCTGALLCGAAGLLQGVRTTTHWSAMPVLKYFGAVPVNARVVVHGKHISAAGVTSGIDGALLATSLLRDEGVAQRIQLTIEYAPAPPFNSGSPETAPEGILNTVRLSYQKITDSRVATAKRIAAKLGVGVELEG